MFGTFKGGIHPPENKHISENKKFINLSVPQTCYIPMQQHIGAPAKPIVAVGDVVTEGQLIGEAQGFISAPVHASIPGKVVEVGEIMTANMMQTGVVIEAEGAFSSGKQQPQEISWSSLTKEAIIEKIKNSGIVGLGGAAFPTSVKLSPPPGKMIDTLVLNGAECEPYLTVDDMLMQTHPAEIIEGIRILLHVLGISKAIIGIEDNKPAAAKALKEAIAKINPKEQIEVKSLKTKYPQGAEKQLIYSLLKREVPSRGLPMDVHVVVQNVGTAFAVHEAVVLDKPLFERYITVSGSLIEKPGNYKVRVGTRISDIVEECGGLKGEPAKIVIGGPMCGTSVYSLDVPVVKGCSGILFMSEKEVNREGYTACIRCGKCVQACPVGLVPCDLGAAAENDRIDIAENLNPFDCIMCGTCTYSCPAGRPLSHFIKQTQQQLSKK